MVELTPSGRSFLDPAKILERSGVGPGNAVGDFGVGGAAYFAVQAAKMVGERGQIFGVDILKPALSSAQSKARLSGCRNFIPIWSDLEVIGGARGIRDGSLDFGILVNVLFHSRRQKNILSECARMLKPGARMLIVEWKAGGLRFGPKHDQILPKERVLDLCAQVGLAPFEEFEAGPYHYALIVVKSG